MKVMSFCVVAVASVLAGKAVYAGQQSAPQYSNEPPIAQIHHIQTIQEMDEASARLTESLVSGHSGEDIQRQLVVMNEPEYVRAAQAAIQAQDPNIKFAPDKRLVTAENFSYRADGKMVGYQDSQEQVQYLYDGLGRVVAKKVTQAGETFTQSYVYEGMSNRILLAKGGDSSVTTYLDGQGPNEHLGEVKNGVAKGYVTDHLGSVLNGDAAGDSHSFGLFGEVNDSPSLSASSSPTMFGFAGMPYAPESGNYFTPNRNYNPGIGRWLSQDPVGYAGGDENYYRYVKNNPVNSSDPSGLFDPAPPVTDPIVNSDQCVAAAAASFGTCLFSNPIVKAVGGARMSLLSGCLLLAEGGPAVVGACLARTFSWTGVATLPMLVAAATDCMPTYQSAYKQCTCDQK